MRILAALPLLLLSACASQEHIKLRNDFGNPYVQYNKCVNSYSECAASVSVCEAFNRKRMKEKAETR